MCFRGFSGREKAKTKTNSCRAEWDKKARKGKDHNLEIIFRCPRTGVLSHQHCLWNSELGKNNLSFSVQSSLGLKEYSLSTVEGLSIS